METGLTCTTNPATCRYRSSAPGLEVGNRVALRLTLPGTPVTAKISGEVCWCDNAGSAGMEFVQVPALVKEQLASWLADRLEEYLEEETVVKC